MEKGVQEGLLRALATNKDERASFLEAYCGNDSDLRRLIEELLPRYEKLADELERPALGQFWALKVLAGAESVRPGTRIGSYVVEREIGRGGMGVVYLASLVDHVYEKRVAIKLVARHNLSDRTHERFHREMQFLAALEHPNISRLLDGDVTEDGVPYLVMEYVEGVPLNEFCGSKPVPIARRLDLFRQVCAAVQFAHAHLIVHRDLKPGNILVSADGVPHLLDFGIAKLLTEDEAQSATLSGTGQFPMTPEFASPEQVRGERLTTASDVYSLGIILYELLAKQRPYQFAGFGLDEIVSRVCFDTPATPSAASGDASLRGDLDAIVMKSLRKEPELRYPSAQSLSDDIGRYLSGLPVEAARGNVVYQLRKFAWRHRLAAVSGLTIAAALCAGIIATASQASIARRERSIEARERIHAEAVAARATEQERIAQNLAVREDAERIRAEMSAAEALQQRKEADSRFDEVRGRATAFLFEFDGAIANVSGAIEARKLVVSRGLEYLDKLARDRTGDDSLQQEIAGAYERLAGIQGNIYGSNPGQYRRATDTYEKALAIRKELAARHPRDYSLKRDLGNSYIQAADGWFPSGDTRNVIAYHEAGLKILLSLPSSGDRSKSVQSGIHRATGRPCNFLLSEGDHRGAIENCRSAVRTSQALLAESPDDLALRMALAAAYAQYGNALRLDNRHGEAMPQLELAAAEFDRPHSLQPENNGYAQNVAGAYTLLGNTEMALGEPRKAIASFEKAIATVREMIRVDPVDARARTTLGFALIRLALLLDKEGRSSEALKAGSEGLNIFKDFADSPEGTPDDWNNYASFLHEIGVAELRNPPVSLVYSKRAVAASSKPGLVFLNTLADAYFDTDDVEDAIITAERALAQNPAPQGASEAGVRADLERHLQKFRERLAESAQK